MKNTLIVEYNGVSKRHEVFTEGYEEEVGRISKSGKQYEVHLRNSFIGYSTSPYTGKQLIFDTLYPEEKQLREERKKKREIDRQAKEKRIAKEKAQKELENKAIVNKMNEIRESEAYRVVFCNAVKKVFPEHENETIERLCAMCRIMMNGIALHIIGGASDIAKAIKRNDNEGRILRHIVDDGFLETMNQTG